jgi:hypothetical protein
MFSCLSFPRPAIAQENVAAPQVDPRPARTRFSQEQIAVVFLSGFDSNAKHKFGEIDAQERVVALCLFVRALALLQLGFYCTPRYVTSSSRKRA